MTSANSRGGARRHGTIRERGDSLQVRVYAVQEPITSVPLSHALDEWLRTVEIEDTRRRTYIGYIERTIKSGLGSIAIDKVSARNLETPYAGLRRCRSRYDGRPFLERHRLDGEHDCVKKKCVPHTCKQMAASTVRQIHSISAARCLPPCAGTGSTRIRRASLSVRGRRPRSPTPSPADAARLLDAAFEMDDDWGSSSGSS